MEAGDQNGSPSFVRHRTNRNYEVQINNPLNSQDRRYVFIHDIHDKQVGGGLLQDMVVGDILHGKPLSLDDAVVFIQQIIISEIRVHELNLVFLSDCLHKFIRWPRSQVKESQLLFCHFGLFWKICQLYIVKYDKKCNH